jgi:hypothetical protein
LTHLYQLSSEEWITLAQKFQGMAQTCLLLKEQTIYGGINKPITNFFKYKKLKKVVPKLATFFIKME